MEAKVKKLIFEFRNSKWNEKVESLNAKDNSIWQMTKSLLRVPSKFPPLHGLTGMKHSNQEKADTMADTLENTFTPNDNPSNLDKIDEVEEAVYNLRYLDTPVEDIDLCSPSEVRGVIHNLKNNKAPGLDNLPNAMFKQLTRKSLVFLTKIFNSMLKLKYFPTIFKKSKIILFPKPGKDPMFPQNYRPISLLIAMSKIFEKLLLCRMQKHIDSENILANEQFGFRSQHSTCHQLLRLTEKITSGFNSNRVTAVVFLDIAQAFDRVWHDGLVHKLMLLKFPPYIIHIIQSYLTDRTFEVHLLNSISSTRPIKAGVPQGSILGPTLFNLYINDIPRSPNTELALYADDTAIIAQSLRGKQACQYLEEALSELEDWYEDWRIKVNVSKSNAVLFTRKKKTSRKKRVVYNETSPIELFDEVIPWQREAKYLGVTLDAKLNWNTHIRETAKKAKSRLGMLCPVLNNKSKLSI